MVAEISNKADFLKTATKVVTVDGLTCKIKRLKAGELLDIAEEEGGERAQALRLFSSAVIEPEFTDDEFMQLDVHIYMGVAEEIKAFSKIEEDTSSEVRKSVDSEPGGEPLVPVLDSE